MKSYKEGPINFMPSYKFDKGTNVYDTSVKKRTPSWCDRVLVHYKKPYLASQKFYKMAPLKISDHRPVIAYYSILVRKINHEKRMKVLFDL